MPLYALAKVVLVVYLWHPRTMVRYVEDDFERGRRTA